MSTDRYHYRAFGLNLESEFRLPSLLSTEMVSDVRSPDVVISRARIEPIDNSQLDEGYFFQDGGRFYFDFGEIARVLVSGGCNVQVDPLPAATEASLQLFILGSSFGAILHQRGLFPLHASCVKIGNVAIPFAGDSGAGKSTLAGAFCEMGQHVLSDDITVVRFDSEGEPHAEPAYPQMKLWSSSIDILSIPEEGIGGRLLNRLDKFEVEFARCFSSDSCKIGAIVVLEWNNSGEIEFEVVEKIRAVHLLREYTYRFSYIDKKEAEVLHFKKCVELATRVPVYRFARSKKEVDLTSIAAFLSKQFA